MYQDYTRFKVGDLVKVIDIQNIAHFVPELKIGDVGQVSAIRDLDSYDVTFPEIHTNHNNWTFRDLDLEPAEATAKIETLLDVLKKADCIELDGDFIKSFSLDTRSENDDYLVYSDQKSDPTFTKAELQAATQDSIIPNQWKITHTESGEVFYLTTYKLVPN